MARLLPLPFPRRRLALLGAALGVGLLGWATLRLDAAALAAAWDASRILPWLPLGLASYLAGQVLRGVRSRLLLRDTGISLASATHVVAIGQAVNHLLPARAGELARAAAISDRTGLPFASSLTVLGVERVSDGLGIAALLLLGGLATLSGAGWLDRLPPSIAREVWIAVTLLGVAALLLALLVSYPPARLARRVSDRLAALARPAFALRIAALGLCVWLLEAGLYLALLGALSLPLRPDWAFAALAVTNLGLLRPALALLGPFQGFCAATLQALGVAAAPAAAYATLAYATLYLPIVAWGVSALLVYGLERVGRLVLQRSARRLPMLGAPPAASAGPAVGATATIGPARPPALLEAVIHGLLFTHAEVLARLPEAQRRRVMADVLDFVQGEIDALHGRLRGLFYLGMTAFGLAVRLQAPRGLASLPPERSARMVASWAFGRWSAPRKLFRPIRSTALLAFYEHPTVVEVLDEAAPPRHLRQVKP